MILTMRRFSQRNPLVTLSDINITPLLDLAFVLLVIFIITTTPIVNGPDSHAIHFIKPNTATGHPYSPMIFTRTRLRRRPSNSA